MEDNIMMKKVLSCLMVLTFGLLLTTTGWAVEPIKVGGIFDMSGGTADVGKDYAIGAIEAEKYINANGGVNGKPIKLIPNDYAYQIPQATSLYKGYKDEGIFVIQGWGTGDTNALKELTNRDKIVYISASYDGGLTDPSKTPYNFFVGTDYNTSIALAMQFAKDQGGKKVVFIYPDHPYGKNPIPAGKEAAKKLGLEIGPDENVPLNAKDATSQLLSMKKYNPDWAWIGGTTASAAVIIKDAAKLGLPTKFVVNVWGVNENTLKLAGDAANDRVFGMAPFATFGENVPGMAPLVEQHKKSHPGDTHIVPFVQGWTAMMVMWEGLKIADKKGQLNSAGLKAALETIKDFDTKGLTAAPITFTPTDHRPNTKLYIYGVSGGKLVKVKEVETKR
jgi:branched-chain amino acid transport system substrate-binding protein